MSGPGWSFLGRVELTPCIDNTHSGIAASSFVWSDAASGELVVSGAAASSFAWSDAAAVE